MAEKKGFEFLEHTADVYIAAYGEDLPEAFENAALAMFDVMTEVEKIGPDIEDRVDVTGEDEFALLYNWLEALLVKFDVSGMLYSKFEVWHLGQIKDRLVLNARIWGEKFDPNKHLQKVGVKAVTYHRMEIIKHPSEVTLRFILDI
jgi:SHS2 domain-containing protein